MLYERLGLQIYLSRVNPSIYLSIYQSVYI